MKAIWLVSLAVVFAFVWASAVVAGPKHPMGGDPDIWERARPATTFSSNPGTISSIKSIVVDLVVFKTNLRQQEYRNSATVKGKRLPSVSEPIAGRR
jgi:hypothetical protein